MADATNDESMKLGGNIELTGFKELDIRSMIILKKIIGNYVRKFSDSTKRFKAIRITLKEIGKKKGHEQFEVKTSIDVNGKQVTAENTDRNIFVAVGGLLKKAEKELSKHQKV